MFKEEIKLYIHIILYRKPFWCEMAVNNVWNIFTLIFPVYKFDIFENINLIFLNILNIPIEIFVQQKDHFYIHFFI